MGGYCATLRWCSRTPELRTIEEHVVRQELKPIAAKWWLCEGLFEADIGDKRFNCSYTVNTTLITRLVFSRQTLRSWIAGFEQEAADVLKWDFELADGDVSVSGSRWLAY